MDDWEKFNKTSLPEKEDFYSHLNIEHITNANYVHDLYVYCDTLLLAEIFENIRNMCIDIYEFDPANFLLAWRSAWQAALKKTKMKLDILTDIEVLLMVEEV